MVLSLLLTVLATSAVATRSSQEIPYFRDYFYVGGGYVDNGSGEHIFRDQMYVEKLQPVGGATQDNPIVMIHGQGKQIRKMLSARSLTNSMSSSDRHQFLEQARRRYWLGQPILATWLRGIHR